MYSTYLQQHSHVATNPCIHIFINNYFYQFRKTISFREVTHQLEPTLTEIHSSIGKMMTKLLPELGQTKLVHYTVYLSILTV